MNFNGHPAPSILLLADALPWTANVAAEACALGIAAPVLAASARDAILHLAGGTAFGYLLLQPSRMGPLRTPLIEMTVDAADRPIRMVLLGDPDNTFKIPGAIHADAAPGWLGRAMSVPAPRRETVRLGDAELRRVLGAGALHASYQPLVRAKTGWPVGLEALSRLQHPRRGTLAPAMFVPDVEAGGMAWTLFQLLTARVMKDWNTHAMARLGMPVGLNITVDEMLLPDLPAWLRAQCFAADMPPSMIVLEMTETQPILDIVALQAAVKQLAAAGFAVMIDDVGPGLRDPVGLMDVGFAGMKIDKLLVNLSARSPDARQSLVRLLDRARQAGLTTIAEGVEDAATLDHVRALNFDLVQGFHVSRPLPAAAVAIWHHAHAGSEA